MFLQHIEIAEIIVNGDAGIVEEDVQAADFGDCPLDLQNVGYVQCQRRYSFIGNLQRATSTCINPLRSSSKCLMDECAADAAVGTGNQDRLIRDVHNLSPLCTCASSVVWPVVDDRPQPDGTWDIRTEEIPRASMAGRHPPGSRRHSDHDDEAMPW